MGRGTLLREVDDVRHAPRLDVLAYDAHRLVRDGLLGLIGGSADVMRADHAVQFKDPVRHGAGAAGRLAREHVQPGPDAPVPEGRDVIDAEPLVLDVFDTALRLAAGSGVTVRMPADFPSAAAGSLTVMGDAMALRRALLNLVDNALKYTPSGGTVELSLTRDGGEAVVAVRDTGVGIAPDDLDRIFDPFVRLDTAPIRPTAGTGLGLAIARSIVTAHAGHLRAESAPGSGSTFTVSLPLA